MLAAIEKWQKPMEGRGREEQILRDGSVVHCDAQISYSSLSIQSEQSRCDYLSYFAPARGPDAL